VPGIGLCQDVFAHHGHYSAGKLMREVPAFRPRIPLEEGMRQVIAAMDSTGRIPAADSTRWEDEVIDVCQRQGTAQLLVWGSGASSVEAPHLRKRVSPVSPSSQANPKELLAQLLARAATDATLRQSLQRDAKAVLEKELGLTLPPDVTLQVLQETANVRYLVIPPSQPDQVSSGPSMMAGPMGWRVIDPG
jgi:hypothetical protein